MTIEKICSMIVPFVLALSGVLILASKQNLFESFIRGAKRGFNTSIELFFTLSALFCAISMLNACGLFNIISVYITRLGISELLAPFLLLRPISGAGSTAMLADIFKIAGADSLTGIIASVIMASSDTLIYIISVYYSAAGIKKSRFTVPAAVISMTVSVISAILICNYFFSGRC